MGTVLSEVAKALRALSARDPQVAEPGRGWAHHHCQMEFMSVVYSEVGSNFGTGNGSHAFRLR
jgi:hypothetical protein